MISLIINFNILLSLKIIFFFINKDNMLNKSSNEEKRCFTIKEYYSLIIEFRTSKYFDDFAKFN